MFRPQKVYLDKQDKNLLTYDLFTDIQPLTTMPANAPVLNTEAAAMNVAVGSRFDIEHFLGVNYPDKKTIQKARTVLTYLNNQLDDSILKLGANGGFYYKSSLVPEGDLSKILQNLVSKKSKTLVHGEYYILSCLVSAPPSILNLINPSKLKICNSQMQYKLKGPPMGATVPAPKPKFIPLPPGPLSKEAMVEVKTANPFNYKPNLPPKNPPILKTATTISKDKRAPSAVQKKFNAKTVPAWYKVL